MTMPHLFRAAIAVIALSFTPSVAMADLDGHGPDAWRVIDVAANDRLNARMGPGANYPVIATFAPNERGMQQVTCVPLQTPAHYASMTQAQIKALPAPWCLMRDQSMSKAGWVAQRYITPDNQAAGAVTRPTPARSGRDAANATMDPVTQAQNLVREIYQRQRQSENSNQPSAFDPAVARNYFTDDIVAWLASGDIDAHPLYGAQDFDGTLGEPTPDPRQPMLRGMITINVDFTNFGKRQRAVFYVRPDTTKPNAPLRVFRVEHDGWSYP